MPTAFDQFTAAWNASFQADRFALCVERDLMEWEALTTKRRELLG